MWGLRDAVGPESGRSVEGPFLHAVILKHKASSFWQEPNPSPVAGPGLRPSLCPSLATGSGPGPDTHLLVQSPCGSRQGGWRWGLQTCLSSPLRAPWSLPSPYPLRSPFPSSPSLLPCPVPAPPSPPPLAIRAAAAGPDPPGSARPLAEPLPPPRLLRRRPPTGVRGAGHKTGQSRRPGH